MIVYLTFNDAPSGIYASQVIDVVKFLAVNFNKKIRLIAFISLRNYFANRKKIQSQLPEALIIPMYPGVKNWQKNKYVFKLICFFLKPQTIISRSVLATQLALMSAGKKTKIVYDGRGAIAAEWKEYEVVNDAIMLRQIQAWEADAVTKSNYRIAVSNQLVKHWQSAFKYTSNQHVVIPCTLNPIFEKQALTTDSIHQARSKHGFKPEDCVFVYSGALSGWQSFGLLYQFMVPVFKQSANNKLLFLSGTDTQIEKLKSEYPEQVLNFQVNPNQVPEVLIAADYGLLIREQSITNLVASPVKFAEYLACGLKVIISRNLGDYSDFVVEKDCGYHFEKFVAPDRLTVIEKQKIKDIAIFNFTKKSYTQQYTLVLGE